MSPRWNPERQAWVFVARSVRTKPMTSRSRRRRRDQLIALYGRHCWLCNRSIIDEGELTVDHVVPRALGGTHRLNNLRLAHDRCNSQRGSGPVPVLVLTEDMRVHAERKELVA